jgi:uncharacterized membrane protein YoaK (UPF0700 family)
MAGIAGDNTRVHLGRWNATPTSVRDVLLVGLALSSGAVDAIAWLGLSKIFTAFQTGNLVFLGIDIADAGGPSGWRIVISLAAFGAGIVLAIPIVKETRGASVWPRRVSVALGVAVLVQAAFLVEWVVTSGEPSTRESYLLIGLSALAMGLQSGAILSLGVGGVLNTAATATFVGLVSDLAGWSRSVTEERRFLGVLVGLVAGSIAGALLMIHARDYAAVLPPVVTILVIAAAEYVIRPLP